jgi:hypothetical protein
MTAVDDSYAVVVGISAYRQLTRLPPTVVNDARDVHALLIDPNAGGYRREQAQLLLDEAATGAALRTALAGLASAAGPESTVLVYFSGHGGRVENGPETGEYLLPVDSVAESARSLAETSISGPELSQLVAAIPARQLLVVFDCCHAGGIGQPKDALTTGPVLKSGLPEQYYEALRAGRGRVIVASSRSTESSWVLPGASNSLFTTHLLAGLRGGVASDDGLVRVFDLFEYLQPRVTADQPQQHPVFKADLENNFAVALYLGGQKGVVARDEEGYRYDAYISYVDREPDATWVWQTLVPRLEAAGLRVAVSGDVEQPGVARVVGVERGIAQAKRTVLVLSPAYVEDGMAHFENVIAQTMGIQEGTYRLLPVKTAAVDPSRLPVRLSSLTTLDLTRPARAEREMQRLISALQGPLPTRSHLERGAP